MDNHILFVSYALHGHAAGMVAAAEELAASGIKVSYATQKAGQTWFTDSGVRHVEWEPKIPGVKDFQQWLRAVRYAASKKSNCLEAEYMIFKSMVDSYEATYVSLKKIYTKLQPTCVVIRLQVFSGIDLARRHDIPCITFMSYTSLFLRHKRLYARHKEIKQHRKQFAANGRPFELAGILCRYILLGRQINKLRKQKLKQKKIAFGSTLVISGTNEFIENVTHLSSKVHMTGTIIPKHPAPPSVSLRQWLDESVQVGIVYVAFGSLVATDQDQLIQMAEGLKACDCRVLWAIPEKFHYEMSNLSHNFNVIDFAPQIAVLSHAATKVFVSHCGAGSVLEALYFGRPILGMPVFLDHPYYADRIVSLGLGLAANRFRFTPDEIREKITRLLHEDRFTERAKYVSAKLQKQNGRQKAADIIARFACRQKK